MGVDARWICHTCKTMCYADGARSYLNHKLTLEDAIQFLADAKRFVDKSLRKVFLDYSVGLTDSSEIESLRDFVMWAARHKGHKTVLTNDMSVSRDDFPDYRAESVGGVVDKTTFGEDLDTQAKYYLENYCPCCSSYIGDHPDLERITGVVKSREIVKEVIK